MKNIKIIGLLIFLFGFMSCQDQFEEFPFDPNKAGENDLVPPEFLLRNILNDISKGADVTEEPLEYLSRLNQFTTGLTFPLYGGSNQYNWTDTGSSYPWLRDIIKLEENAVRANGPDNNAYLSIAKFLRAYTFVWLTQRVGDIPMQEAGLGNENLTPSFDLQKDVYFMSLELLKEANEELSIIIDDPLAIGIDGDIHYDNDLTKWQKAVNAYSLRVLISLSKRADDISDLNIKSRFAEIVNNPGQYPLFTSIEDNMNFEYVPVFNRYPTQFKLLYPRETTVSKTFLELTTQNEDPRTFIAATPSPVAINEENLTVSDFNAYRGSDNARPQGDLFAESQGNSGVYSYLNNLRYLQGVDVIPEPYIMIGYSEMCFNIAEAINRGWLAGDAESFYMKGVESSLEFYELSQGSSLQIGDVNGALLGDVTINTETFLSNIAYQGNNPEGLKQILEQKYVAFWQNSGWEPFYQYRRTGIPEFSEGSGTNPQGKIPIRWQYPVREVDNNRSNAKEAIDRQFPAGDNVFEEMWLIKN